MRMFATTALVLCGLALSVGQAAAQSRPVPMTERTERFGLEGRRGPSLFRPGFGFGEYSGSAASRSSSTRLPWQSRDMARSEFSIASPTMAEVTGDCGGGQSHSQILWITFDRENLSYDCVYGGSAPAGARLSLALSRGTLMGRLQQPQRAGELTWGGVTLKAETKRIGGLPIGNGVLGYVFTRDGVEVGGLDLNGMRPTFYLPPQGSPDRDAVAVLAISLFTFQDPARR